MNISKVAVIAWHEYITNVRRVAFIFVTLLFPALGVLGIVVAGFFSGQATRFLTSQFVPETKPIGVVDHSKLYTPIPAQFADRFVAFSDEETAKQALIADQVGTFIVIPSDYIDSGKITSYGKGGMTSATVDSSALRVFLVNGLLAGKVDAKTLTRASRPSDLTPITLDSKGKPTTSGNPFSFVAGFMAPYFLSILLVISIFSSSSYLLRSVSEEKETRVIEIILSSISPTELMAGKVLGLGLLGLTQVLVWVLSAFALSGGAGALIAGAVIVLNPMTFVLATTYFVLGYLVFAIIMATAGSLGTNMRESQQLAGLFTFAAAVPYMLSGFLFTNPNALVARVMSWFPLTAPTMMMLRLPLGEVPIEDIFGSIVVLLITIPILLWAGAKIFRIGLLMYGKRPSVTEIWSALRKA